MGAGRCGRQAGRGDLHRQTYHRHRQGRQDEGDDRGPGGTVLEYVDTPIAETSQPDGPADHHASAEVWRRWTHALAINDLYFDFMGPSLAAAGIDGGARRRPGPPVTGRKAAFQRIRTGQYQAVTVAEPLNLQGWQLVDELNRAIQGEACSGY
jgi:ribose transport system substrate-binding protein